MRRFVGTIVFASVLAFAPTWQADAAPRKSIADGGIEAAFVSAINSIRVSRELEPLQVYGELVAVARNWTDRMIGAGDISHNSNLAGSVGAPWVRLGENVGIGYTVQGLINAFVASPSHMKNIVQPDFRWIGVGVTWNDDGRMMTTHLFMTLAGDDAAPAPAPEPPAEPAPAPTPAVPDPGPAGAATGLPYASGTQASPLAPSVVPPPPADPVRVRAVLASLRHVTA